MKSGQISCNVWGSISLKSIQNSTERFAYLTGRSVSSFKRDFKEAFSETPSRWLSHFSFAFRKEFKVTPGQLARQIKSVDQ